MNDHDRLQSLADQAASYPSSSVGYALTAVPDGLRDLDLGELDAKLPRLLSKAFKKTVDRCEKSGGAEDAQRDLSWIARKLERVWSCRGKPDQAIEAVEEASKILKDSGHQHIMWCCLANLARQRGDIPAAQNWLNLCDPTPDRLDLDSAYRVCAAGIALQTGATTDALEIVGERGTDIPFDPSSALRSTLIRVAALQQLSQTSDAVEELSNLLRTHDREIVGAWITTSQDPALDQAGPVWYSLPELEVPEAPAQQQTLPELMKKAADTQAPKVDRDKGDGEHFLRCKGCSEEIPLGFSRCPNCQRRVSLIRRLRAASRDRKSKMRDAFTGFSWSDVGEVGIVAGIIAVIAIVVLTAVLCEEEGSGTSEYASVVERSIGLVPLDIGQTANGELGEGGDHQVYLLRLDRHESLTIEARSSFDNYLKLFAETESRPMTVDDDSGEDLNARINVQLQPGNYHILVRPYSSDSSGRFTLSLRRSHGNAPATRPRERQNLDMPFRVGEQWGGSYVCAQGLTRSTVAIESVDGTRVGVIFSFHYVPRGVVGEFLLSGDYDPETRRLVLVPGEWISQPSGYTSTGLGGTVSADGNQYTGRINHPDCRGFTLTRIPLRR